MTYYDLFSLLIAITAIIIAFILFKKVRTLFSKDKQKSYRIIETVTAGVLATILYVIIEKYSNSIQTVNKIDFASGKLFFNSFLIAFGQVFIETAIMLLVVSLAVYFILKPIMREEPVK